MAVDRRERRLRNVQSLILVGAMIVAVGAAVLLGWIGVPAWAAISATPIVYLACWRLTLREVRRRRAARTSTASDTERTTT